MFFAMNLTKDGEGSRMQWQGGGRQDRSASPPGRAHRSGGATGRDAATHRMRGGANGRRQSVRAAARDWGGEQARELQHFTDAPACAPATGATRSCTCTCHLRLHVTDAPACAPATGDTHARTASELLHGPPVGAPAPAPPCTCTPSSRVIARPARLSPYPPHGLEFGVWSSLCCV